MTLLIFLFYLHGIMLVLFGCLWRRKCLWQHLGRDSRTLDFCLSVQERRMNRTCKSLKCSNYQRSKKIFLSSFLAICLGSKKFKKRFLEERNVYDDYNSSDAVVCRRHPSFFSSGCTECRHFVPGGEVWRLSGSSKGGTLRL